MTGQIYDPTQNSEIWRTTLIADRTTQTGSHSDPHLPVLKSLGNSPRAGARRRSPGLGGPVTMETYPDGGTWFQLCIVGEDVLAQVVAREKTTHYKDKHYTVKLGYIEHLQLIQTYKNISCITLILKLN